MSPPPGRSILLRMLTKSLNKLGFRNCLFNYFLIHHNFLIFFGRKHRDNAIRQKYFEKWRYLQQTRKDEWKLEIRAEYHDRY